MRTVRISKFIWQRVSDSRAGVIKSPTAVRAKSAARKSETIQVSGCLVGDEITGRLVSGGYYTSREGLWSGIHLSALKTPPAHPSLCSYLLLLMTVDFLTLWRPLLSWASECPDAKNYKWRLNMVWHRMLYSCTQSIWQQWASKSKATCKNIP